MKSPLGQAPPADMHGLTAEEAREFWARMDHAIREIAATIRKAQGPFEEPIVQAYTQKVAGDQSSVQTFMSPTPRRVGFEIYNNSGGENLLLAWERSKNDPAPASANGGPFWTYNIGNQQMLDKSDLGYRVCPKGELVGRWETSTNDEEAFVTQYVLINR